MGKHIASHVFGSMSSIRIIIVMDKSDEEGKEKECEVELRRQRKSDQVR